MTAERADAWGVPQPGPRTYTRWGDAAELRPTPAFAPRSLAWRAQQEQLRRQLADRLDREAHRRRLRKLEHLDAMVTRCRSCGEWRMRNLPCEVMGCTSPIPAPAWPERPQLAVVE
jgi:hypothetical protein